MDSCPVDALNDADNDGICESTDSCPFDIENDADSDSVCTSDQCVDLSCKKESAVLFVVSANLAARATTYTKRMVCATSVCVHARCNALIFVNMMRKTLPIAT